MQGPNACHRHLGFKSFYRDLEAIDSVACFDLGRLQIEKATIGVQFHH